MQRTSTPLSASSINLATRIAQEKVKAAFDYVEKLTSDPKKEGRLAKHFCKACFYSPPRLAGAAMTTCNCGCCETPQMYGSTNTDKLCAKCAVTHELCKHCGGDMEMRIDRK